MCLNFLASSFQIITVFNLLHFPYKKCTHFLYTKMWPSTQIFSSADFHIFCLKLLQSKSVPQESGKDDGQQNMSAFMFSWYPFLLIQYIPSTSVGVYNSFIQEEIKLWF